MSNTQLRRVAVRAALTLTALVAVSAGAGAQQVQKDPPQPPAGQGRGGPGGGRGMQMLFEGITLTEAQQKSVDSVRAAFREKMQGAQGEDRRTIMQDQQKAVRGLLTPDQQKVYDANVEKMRAGRPGGPATR